MESGFETSNDLLKELGISPIACPVEATVVDGSNQPSGKQTSTSASTPQERTAEFYARMEKGRENIDAVMKSVGVDINAMFCTKEPTFTIQNEKPIHRTMIYMKAKGASNKEIARTTEYSEVMVSMILRQPWARQLMTDIVNQAGGDMVRTVLEAAAVDSVYKLIELRDNEKVQPAVQRAACVDLLDRFMGKPTQQVELRHEQVAPKDLAEIDRNLDALKAEENRLQGTFTS